MREPRGVVLGMVALLLVLAVEPVVAQQSGYYVLDGLGGVHAGGGAPAVFPQTPYFGFDAAEDIVYIPPGSSGLSGVLVLDAFGGVWAGGGISGGSLAPATPYFGFDIARGIAAKSSGVSGWERRSSSCFTLNPGFSVGLPVSCPGTKKVTGGGPLYFSDNTCSTVLNLATASRFVTHNGPSADGQWLAGVTNSSGAPIYVQAFAICVDAS